MHLYNLTLQKSQAITHAIYGSFSKPGAEEILTARGRYIEIFVLDEQIGKLVSLLTWECFGILRDIISFRLAGAETDYIVAASDSGSIAILRYNAQENRMEAVQNEVYGKTGCRRAVPGQFLAKDPKGRAVMIGAIEKQKLVYILDRDNNENLIISSPLEAHKSSTICFDIIGMDVEYENPLFACLEIDFSELENFDIKSEERVAKKVVTFYELDLGLNTVTRKQLVEVDPQAKKIVAVPGGEEGPGGCLVFSLNWVTYISEDQEEQIRTPFPRRNNFSKGKDRDLLISCTATHVQKNMYFFLAQSEVGDIYKITLMMYKESVTKISVKYFDTIPPSSALCVTRTGLLFSASEFGEHRLFTFKSLGSDEKIKMENKRKGDEKLVLFEPDPLKNLEIADTISSLAPLLFLKVLNPTREPAPQIYAFCGRGPRSELKVLRYGLEVSEMAVSSVPGTPTAVWSLKKTVEEKYHSHIVLSFEKSTLVLSVGEMVEEVTDSGFLLETKTLAAATISGDIFMQVHQDGIRLVRQDKRVDEWKPPTGKRILAATANENQIAIILTDGDLILFEGSSEGGTTNISESARKSMGPESSCVALAPVPPGQRNTRFVAVGGSDRRVRVLSLPDPGEDLEPALVSTQILDGAVSSVLISYAVGLKGDKAPKTLSLFAGTENGRLATSSIDTVEGKLSAGRQRYLGARAVKLFSVTIDRAPAVLALSARSWLHYGLQGQTVAMPLAYTALENASAFCSEQCPEGVVAVCGQSLRIWAVEKLRDFFHTTRFPLRYTPRSCEVHPVTGSLIICESDRNTVPVDQRKKDLFKKENGADEEDKLRESFKSVFSRDENQWGSCLRMMEPSSGRTLFLEEFSSNCAVFCLTTCIFQNRPDEIFLVAGGARGLSYSPRMAAQSCFLRVYRFFDNHSSFQLFHETEIEEIPQALCSFQGMLLAGVGSILKLYELGKRKLLRKSENRQFPGAVRKIHTMENRIFVTDSNSGTFVLNFTPIDKSLKIFADSVTKFYSTTSILLDYNTIASGDKFGNVVISKVRGEEEEKLKTSFNIPYGGYLNCAGVKMDDIVKYYVGDVITSLEKSVLNPGGEEVIIYGTIMGGIGVFYPLRTREEVDFFVHLETHMRQNAPAITGRRHIDFRSAFFPVKGCVDGDLCEQFSSMKSDLKNLIASEMVMKDAEAIKKRVEIARSHVI